MFLSHKFRLKIERPLWIPSSRLTSGFSHDGFPVKAGTLSMLGCVQNKSSGGFTAVDLLGDEKDKLQWPFTQSLLYWRTKDLMVYLLLILLINLLIILFIQKKIKSSKKFSTVQIFSSDLIFILTILRSGTALFLLFHVYIPSMLCFVFLLFVICYLWFE